MGFKGTLNTVTVGLGFLVGYIILGVLLRGTHWRVAQGTISGQFGALPRPRHFVGLLHVSIGLQQVEISLTGRIQNGTTSLVNYRESFMLTEDSALVHHLRRGLRGGLPYPVLTLLEHLSIQDGVWGERYAFAGRLVMLLLWSSFASGVVSALLGYLGEERHLSACLAVTGALLLTAIVTHDVACPSGPPTIHFPKGQLIFTRGWCYILLLYLGVSSMLVSFVSLAAFHLERIVTLLRPLVSFVQKLDHFFQKHSPGIKPTA